MAVDGLRELEVAAWIHDSHGRLLEANQRAEELFGQALQNLRGQPCSCFLTEEDSEASKCSGLTQKSEDSGERGPVEARLTHGPYSGRWLRVVPIALRDSVTGCSTSTLCLGLDIDRPRRIERYLERIANRSGLSQEPRRWKLTPRESEILGLLASDLDSYAVSRQLHISYATVRNHIQRILGKLAVHSIQEAIALYLLLYDQKPGCSLAS